ncbi:MAG: nucleoside-diphosphate kinase [Planctomycetaceae bacterium]|jgi:nucleoside-diphosphate kinase|nr:nucleoside-diphosphate kinase [Planctomycetaceae bacterium]
MEQTLVLLKPDTVERGLCGEILGRFERKGLKIVRMQMVDLTVDVARVHYADHVGKPFYPELEKYITSGSIVAIILEGDEAISVVRKMIGVTNGIEAEAGTIRGDLAISKRQNLVHASDSPESAKREIKIFFANIPKLL